jgi:hypothetical protein
MIDASAPSLAADAVSIAAQTGRLDFLTATLAVLAAMVGIFGIYAFFDVRRVAARVAKLEAETVAAAIAEPTAVKYMERELPKLMDAYMELIRNSVADDAANAIAEAQEGGE